MNIRTGKWTLAEIAATAARLLVGGLFIYMGLNKALHPVDFLKLTRDYDLVANHLLLNSIAAALPWFEIFCGLLLVAGVAVRGTAVLLVMMLIPFTLMVLKRALQISEIEQIAFCAVKFDCGCGTGEVYICRKLLENSLLILLSLWLATGVGQRLTLWFSLVGSREKRRAKEEVLQAAK